MPRITAIALLLLAALGSPAAAMMSHCIALAQGPGFVHVARTGNSVARDESSVTIQYLTHSTFLISVDGLNIATDFTGYTGVPGLIPDVVTMNRAHSTHYTDYPDPAIPHVLRGWNPDGGPAEHFLVLDDLLVRNVSTDIRGGYGDSGKYGNSIFVFEAKGMCIAHLGHLHHEPTEEQYAALGRMDIVMAPVDGGMTLSLADMTRVLKRVKAAIVIPMHWFGRYTLEAFLDSMSSDFHIIREEGNSLAVSLHTLPNEPEIVVLEPGSLGRDEE